MANPVTAGEGRKSPAMLAGLLTGLALVFFGCATYQVPVAALPSETSPAPAASASPVLTGTLVGHDGQPAPLAHVHVGEQSVAVGADGTFRVEVPRTGFVRARFSAVNHREWEGVFWVEEGGTRVDVQLGTFPRVTPLEKVVLLTWKDGRRNGPPQPLARRDDGTWAIVLQAPEGRFAYELAGVASTGNSINGTQASAHEYDGGGDYKSVLDAPGGTLTLVFDPAALPPAGVEPVMRFGSARDGRMNAIVAEMRERQERQRQLAIAAMKDGMPPARSMSAHAQREGWLESLATAISQEEDAAVRQLLYVAALSLLPSSGDVAPQGRALADQALAAIEPTSDLWAFSPQALVVAAFTLATDTRGAKAYTDAVIARHPERELVGQLLLSRLRQSARVGDTEGARSAYQVLTSRFAETYGRLAQRFNPDATVRPGARVPAFAFPSFEKPSKALTPESFEGKVYLINLWASWCGPCIAKMDTLHALYARYQKKGFTIIGVAIMTPEEEIRSFRTKNAQRWPMPWVNAYVPEGQSEQVMKQLDAVGLPSAILVGRDGTILATNSTLDQEGALEAEIEKALTTPPSQHANPSAAR